MTNASKLHTNLFYWLKEKTRVKNKKAKKFQSKKMKSLKKAPLTCKTKEKTRVRNKKAKKFQSKKLKSLKVTPSVCKTGL